MNYQDYEALNVVIALAESDVMHHECEEMPMLKEKEAIQITKDGILKYMSMLNRIVAGDLTIDLSDG